MAQRDTSVPELCRELGIRPVTLYRYVGPQGQLREQGPEGPRLLNRSSWTATLGRHPLSVGFRPLPQTTRTSQPTGPSVSDRPPEPQRRDDHGRDSRRRPVTDQHVLARHSADPPG